MKLWIFVLLGLLAQTSHGHLRCAYSSIEQELTEKFTSAIHGCKGSSFIFPLLNINSLKLEVLDLLSVKVTVKHTGNGQFQVVITASLSAGCKGFSIPPLSVRIELNISHLLKNGSPCHEIVADTLKISITTSSNIAVIDLSLGGLLGGVTDLVKSLTNSVSSILRGSLTNIIESVLEELNYKLKGLTNTAGDVHCTVTGITYGATAVGYSLAYTLKSTGETIFSTASQTIAALGAGVSSAWQLPGDALNFLFKSSFSSHKKSIKGGKLHGLNLFSGIEGDFDLSITTPSYSHCTTSSEGALLSVRLGVNLKDLAGDLFLDLDVDIDLRFSVKRSKGQYKFHISESELVKITVKSRHASCGCDDDDTLIESITEIILDLIDEVISLLDCEHEHYPIPGTGYYGPYEDEDEDYECPCDDSGISC